MVAIYWKREIDEFDEENIIFYPDNRNNDPLLQKQIYTRDQLQEYIQDLCEYCPEAIDLLESDEEDYDKWENEVWKLLNSCSNFPKYFCQMVNDGNGDMEPLLRPIWSILDTAGLN